MTAPATFVIDEPASPVMRRAGGMPLSWIAGLLLGWIAFDNILVLGFLGANLPMTLIGAGAAAIGVMVLTGLTASTPLSSSVSWKTLSACMIVAFGLLILGGEGRFLYANADWQIRDAVLADMGRNPWPYSISIKDVAHILRAPIGMYLKPALVGGNHLFVRDIALLASNAFLLGGILTLGSALFDTQKARALALVVFSLFSGMDIVGTAAALASGRGVSLDHLELWIDRSQFSSHLTMIFWVPQHVLAGWLCAALFLLWKHGKLTIGSFAAAMPMMAIWSPLAVMGAVPLAIFACIETILKRQLRTSDVLLIVTAIIIAGGALEYLQTDAGAVASHLTDMSVADYVMVLLLEVLPLSIILICNRNVAALGTTTPIVTVACLVLMPLFCLGEAIDFQMRASIMPLAVLAIGIATLLNDMTETHARIRMIIIVLLGFGAITPLMEVRRAILLRPAPGPNCSLIGAWYQQSGNVVSPASYLAPSNAFPSFLRPKNPHVVTTADPKKCWDHDWARPRF